MLMRTQPKGPCEMSPDEFRRAFDAASPDTYVCYASAVPCIAKASQDEQDCGALAMILYRAGVAMPFQKRVTGPPDGLFNYVVLKRHDTRSNRRR
jgi:hypothetical protein